MLKPFWDLFLLLFYCKFYVQFPRHCYIHFVLIATTRTIRSKWRPKKISRFSQICCQPTLINEYFCDQTLLLRRAWHINYMPCPSKLSETLETGAFLMKLVLPCKKRRVSASLYIQVHASGELSCGER